jgi:hypothetical protein
MMPLVKNKAFYATDYTDLHGFLWRAAMLQGGIEVLKYIFNFPSPALTDAHPSENPCNSV